MTDYTVIFPRHWPISSAKPPRGSRHVPVTNCMSRSLTSLSTSFTSCKDETENARKSDSQELNTYSVCICVRACACVLSMRLYLPEPNDLFAVPGVVSIHCVPLPVLKIDLLHATQHHLDHTNREGPKWISHIFGTRVQQWNTKTTSSQFRKHLILIGQYW